jgi:hypothetical protein
MSSPMPALLISFPRKGGEEGERLNWYIVYPKGKLQYYYNTVHTDQVTGIMLYHAEKDIGITLYNKKQDTGIIYHTEQGACFVQKMDLHGRFAPLHENYVAGTCANVGHT